MRQLLLITTAVIFWPFLMFCQTDTGTGIKKLLDLSLEELLDVNVVTSAGYLQPVLEAPSTIQVITAQQIRERGYEQLEDALRDVPGIDMIHINGYAPTLFYFRGLYGAENLRALLMIDGIVENNIIGSNDMAGPAYSLHNIDHIEIIWGPASALYGANAFGGVINLISKKGSEINGLYAEKGFGSFNTSTAKISLGLKRSNFEFAFSGSTYSSDGPKFTNRDPDYKASYVDRAYSFNGIISYYGKKTKTSIGFRTYTTPIGWGTYSNSPTVYLGLPSQGNNNTGLVGILTRDIRGERPGLDESFLRTLFLQNEFSVNSKLSFTSRLVYRQTGTADNSYVYVTVDGTKLIRAKVATYSNRVSGEFSFNYAASENQKLTAGLQVNQDNVEAGSRAATFDPTVHLVDGKDTVINLGAVFLPRKSDIRNNIGGYLQYALNTKILTKTNFTVGLRYDNNSYFGDAFSPRLVIVNQLTEKLGFKIQFGMAFRAPTNLEIHQAGLNFKLTTEKLKNYEVNFSYAPSKKIQLQLNCFRNELKDVIFLTSLTGLSPDKNPGKIDINGVEGSINIIFSKNINGFVNFTYQDGTSKNTVTNVSVTTPAVAVFKSNAGITAHISDLFSASATANWVGARKVQRTNPYGPVNDYFLMNFSLTTKPLFKERITAGITLHNLFNTKWLDPGFRTADGNVYSTVLEQPGINGLFKICLRLNNDQ